MRMPSWIFPTLSAVLAAGLIAAGAVAVMQYQALDDARDQRDQLSAEVTELRSEVADLEAQLEEADSDAGGGIFDDLLGGLFGSDDDGSGLDGLFGDGGLDGLLDGLAGGDADGFEVGAHGMECMDIGGGQDPGGIDDLFGGLFGGGSPEDADEDLDDLVERVADEVAELRELEWQEPVEAEFLDGAEVGERLEELSELEDEDAALLEAHRDLLATLGAMPADADLAEAQQQLMEDSVAGFYVLDTHEIVVRVPDDGLPSAVDQITLAHELGHALADQVLGLPDRAEPPLSEDADASMAALSAIEGDATLLMNLWSLEGVDPMELLASATDPAMAAQQEALDQVPDVMARELLFPYTYGLDWACGIYLEDGWDGIDAAYEDPPQTTHEILFGENLSPADVASVSDPAGWDQTLNTTFGAADLLWQLEAPGGDTSAALEDPMSLAQNWAGGESSVWRDGDDTAAALSLAFTDGDAGCDTMQSWVEATFDDATLDTQGSRADFDGADQAGAIDCEGTDVRVALADSTDTVDAILD